MDCIVHCVAESDTTDRLSLSLQDEFQKVEWPSEKLGAQFKFW